MFADEKAFRIRDVTVSGLSCFSGVGFAQLMVFVQKQVLWAWEDSGLVNIGHASQLCTLYIYRCISVVEQKLISN